MRHAGRLSHAYDFIYSIASTSPLQMWDHLNLSAVHRLGADLKTQATVISFSYASDSPVPNSVQLRVGLADSEGGSDLPNYLATFIPI